MAYDRYVAICSPLLYSTVMTKRVCMQLVVGSYMGGLLNSLTHTCGLLGLPFCGPSVINHYFCDIPPLLQLACSDTHRNETLLLAFSAVIALFTLFVITASYMLILSVILKIQSDDGRKKTFHTCASHLTAITIFFGSLALDPLHPAQLQLLNRAGESLSSLLHAPGPHAEPLDLQPEKQGGEEQLQKDI